MPDYTTQYRCIGKGFCGSVWSLEGHQDQTTAIKREDGGPGRSVTNDCDMHMRVLLSAHRHPPSTPLSIPQCHELIQPTDAWWQPRLHQFPAGYIACRALISERIPKVPRPISDKIVDLFCAGNTTLADFVKENPDDDACLIRPYLGRRRRHKQQSPSASRFQRFSLRNVPLHLDQMEALGLDTTLYAETMADALAMMHWGAHIDANDVEFVLAPPRTVDSSSVLQSEYLGVHCMWILDFDCCRQLSMDEAGIEQACMAFFRNDPFFPKPETGGAADEDLWQVFKKNFLMASRRIMEEASEDERNLAVKLMERIEDEGHLGRRS
ncbi:uncharacterized protein J7T54_000283 [Emericellopsis cladophorae]|uniref:DUF3669 domain-containing protein n=1 Tax=Emericellopsis cladophorae TaxID=2686198 RepID=A0A9P9XY47_9HYPO|nr:uncharacterized protein J7T54_000283 [Emericellopsis cladophorae]KAI6779982.1 hypothetical protein J7T54_000283 [Emericellopsis cladophorae]